jgi:hypothetical protein
MAGASLERVAGEAAPVIDRLARFGFGAKGIVTILVGGLALRYAMRRGGGVTGQEGAIQTVLDEPFGPIILGVLASGLAGYALWMFAAAIIDADRKGSGLRGIAERGAFFATGVGYALLAYATVELLFGRAGGGGTDLDELAAVLLTPRVGRWFVGLVGGIVMTAGCSSFGWGSPAAFGTASAAVCREWSAS